ncbi:adenylyl-sulfate kinase [Paraburkholderia sp. BCC1885]|uniref:adenylyl-sulfate kinase n=1 Tax=Paraburkholderia sp. BCC1885 TaxID=2562669 RepID=UPI001C903532|nr:adenylyl-sulfate kinase [Paraburkholderia sp. BCC1885]
MTERTADVVFMRERANGHAGAVFWLTGLSGAGKSTLAFGAERVLRAMGYQTYVLDGDRLRRGLNRDLGFSEADRMENMRRVGEVASLLADAGMVTIVALISPLREGREEARRLVSSNSPFHEVYVAADLATCEARDPKGLYRKAHAGELTAFTGISSPYEVPATPDLVIDTVVRPPRPAIDELVAYIRGKVGRP